MNVTCHALCIIGLIINLPAHYASEIICTEEQCSVPCCPPTAVAPHEDEENFREYSYPWYTQWPVLFVLATLIGILFCCIWCLLYKRPECGFVLCSYSSWVRRPASERDSAGSVYPPPRYSRCGSFHQGPPPYSEVTSKPDLYPLVITYGENDAKSGGNYLMVQYFRNYVVQGPGSLSAASTAESLNSSFICNAANEANSIIPPPYSYSGNYEDCGAVSCGRSFLRSLSSLTEREPRLTPLRARLTPEPQINHTRRRDPPNTFRENLITSPVQSLDPSFDLDMELIECEMYCEGGSKPRLGVSPPMQRSPSNTDDTNLEPENYGLRHLFACPSPEIAAACESPPQPTSPTQTSRESTLRRPSDERRHRRLDTVKKTLKMRKSSLYMPLSMAYPVRTSKISPGTRVSSRSAPATPCSSLVPTLLTFTQRVSASRLSSKSSRLEEEKDPLLDMERSDHKNLT